MAKYKRRKQPSLEQQQPYDNALKSLLEGQEAQILPHILPEAIYLETYNIEVIRTILRTDRVYKILYKGEPHILHLEFETSSNTKMGVRLLEYHAYYLLQICTATSSFGHRVSLSDDDRRLTI